jgi:hypothetical protein
MAAKKRTSAKRGAQVKKPAKLKLRPKKPPIEETKPTPAPLLPATKKPATKLASKSKAVETIAPPIKAIPTEPTKPTLSPQQRAAATRKLNREAKAAEAAALAALAAIKKEDRRAAALKGWETRRLVEKLLEKGERVRISKKGVAFLKEKALKSRNETIRALAQEVIEVQAAAVTPTEKIIDTLQSLRREAIENKVGAYPSKLNEAKYVEDDPALITKLKLEDSPFAVQKKQKAGLGTWLEEVDRTSTDAKGKLVMRKFRYRRHHERIGLILNDTTHDRILAKVSEKYREMHAVSARVAAEVNPNGTARGYVKIYGYTLAKSIDDKLIKAYAELVRLRPSDDESDKRRHKLNRTGTRDHKHHKGAPIEDKGSGDKLAVLVDVSMLSSNPNDVLGTDGGVGSILWQWLRALDQSVIVDSFFISIEERDNAAPK